MSETPADSKTAISAKAATPSTGRSFFWPLFILIAGSIISAGYQLMVMQQQLDSLTHAVVEMDGRVKQAQHEKAKLYKLASDVFQLSATDPIARQVVTDYKIQANSPVPATK